MNRLRVVTIAVLCLAFAGVANASWYDDYEAGVKAARVGEWDRVIDLMNKAIRGNPNENNRARTYGAIFINYHPYYYRGVAYLNKGRYEQAIADFEKTSGPGEFDMGSLDTLIKSAKEKLAEPVRPVVEPVRPTPVPQPPVIPTTTAPVIDAGLRSRAQAAVRDARSKLDAARGRAPNSPQISNAVQQYTDVNTRLATARSNEDYNAVIAVAEGVGLLAESIQAPSVPATTTQVASGGTTRPAAATAAVLAVPSQRVRQALESYFQGEFEDATRAFSALTREMPRNGWIWAFLGASQYSQYAFEADETYRTQALKSFREARRLGFGKNGLPTRYFSRRIQRAFAETAG